jgi:hypothetical protein
MIQDACDALATQLSEALGIPAYGYIPLTANRYPIVVMMVDSVTYNKASRNSLSEMNLDVAVLLDRQDEKRSILRAHQLMSPSGDGSFKEAAESDRQLGGCAQDCVVQSTEQIAHAQLGTDQVLVITFKVKVFL